MARLSWKELESIKKKYNVSRLWSWSRISCYETSPYEYFLSYIKHVKPDNDNCAYGCIGGLVHDCLEKYYNNEINYNEMLDYFRDGWVMHIELEDLKFDRNDTEKNNSIKDKYLYDIEHFLTHHIQMSKKVLTEKFITAKIGNNVFQGYIDAMYQDEDKNIVIVDFKTSSKFSSKDLQKKSGQLTVYAIGLMQKGIPFDKIKICFNMLKYATIQYEQKNGAIKTRDVERYKIGESLKTNVKMWLKNYGYTEEEIDKYLFDMVCSNSIDVLPEDVKSKYVINDCYIWVPLTNELVEYWTSHICDVIMQIMINEKKYNEENDEVVFWDADENVEKESYYFATLCGYSSELHKPYKKYLEKLEQQSNGFDVFDGIGSEQSTTFTIDNNDLSWL